MGEKVKVIDYSEPKWDASSIQLLLGYYSDADSKWKYEACAVRPRPLRDKIEDGIQSEELLPTNQYWEAEATRLRQVHSITANAFICKEFPIESK